MASFLIRIRGLISLYPRMDVGEKSALKEKKLMNRMMAEETGKKQCFQCNKNTLQMATQTYCHAPSFAKFSEQLCATSAPFAYKNRAYDIVFFFLCGDMTKKTI